MGCSKCSGVYTHAGEHPNRQPHFYEAVLTTFTLPARNGFYVSITVRRETHWNWNISAVLSKLLSTCTATLIPYLDDDFVEYVISYQLYQDGVPVKMYQHRVQEKTLYWIAAPLAVLFIQDSWLAPPWVGHSKEIAFAETAKLFWLDAHKDGFF